MTIVSPEVAGVQHRMVEAGGLRMHVAEAGPPDGDPVLVLHGWPQHWYQWRHQIPALAGAGYRVIAPDLRGFGQSEAPPKGYDKENMATDVLNLMDAMGLQRVSCSRTTGADGSGSSSARARRSASRSTSRSTSPPVVEDQPAARARLLALLVPGGAREPAWPLAAAEPPGFVRRVIQGSSPNPQAWSDEDIEAFTQPLQEPARAEASVQLYRTFLTKEFGPRRRRSLPEDAAHGPDEAAFRQGRLRDPEAFFAAAHAGVRGRLHDRVHPRHRALHRGGAAGAGERPHARVLRTGIGRSSQPRCSRCGPLVAGSKTGVGKGRSRDEQELARRVVCDAKRTRRS